MFLKNVDIKLNVNSKKSSFRVSLMKPSVFKLVRNMRFLFWSEYELWRFLKVRSLSKDYRNLL